MRVINNRNNEYDDDGDDNDDERWQWAVMNKDNLIDEDSEQWS